MDYKSLMGYGNKKKKKSKSKQNKIVEDLKQEFNINEGPAFEYKKHAKNIDKSLKGLQKSYLDFYELLRKKGLNDEASNLLDTYKKNIVSFKKNYDKIVDKLL